MTPYVVDGEENPVAQKPKSIMVGASNGVHVNGDAIKAPDEDAEAVETPDSLPSRSTVSGRSIIGNGRNGKSGALKRVSFGSSKGSMVETLVYDHQEDLSELPPFLTSPPVVDGDDSRVHPAKVRVKFIESQQVAQVACAPPSPDVTLDFGSDTMTSPTSDHSPDYRHVSHETGVDNPFRPDGELSREADTIVSLIKEGKPITPVKGEEGGAPTDGAADVVQNGYPVDQKDSSLLSGPPHDGGSHIEEVVITPNSTSPLGAKPRSGANGTAKDAPPGVVEVQRGVIVPPSEAPAVEQVVIKKKPKCKCCVIQ